MNYLHLRKFRVLASIILISCFSVVAGQSPAIDFDQSQEILSSQDDWDALFYKIDIHLAFDSSAIYGFVDVCGSSLVNDLSFIDLDMYKYFGDINHNLDVDSVKVVGTSDNNFLQMPTYVRIYFISQTYDIGEEFKVRIYYQGKPGYLIFYNGFNFDTHAGNDIAFDMTQPDYAQRWWPCKDRPDDKADSVHIIIRYPDTLICASNGKLYMESVNQITHEKMSFWKEHYPIAPYHVGIGCTNYDTISFLHTLGDESSTMPVIFYVFPESLEVAEESFPVVDSMLMCFRELFGEYPFATGVIEKYGMMQVTGISGAMEYPTITAIAEDRYDRKAYSHELSHSWWGNCVTCSSWTHFWINEAFATYSEGLWIEYNNSHDSLIDYMDAYKRCHDTETIIVEHWHDPGELFDTCVVYNKGAWVLHMFRHWVGTDTFYVVLDSFLTEYRWGNASTEDFVDVCIDVTGDSRLEDFFDEWIYGEYMPEYEYSYFNLNGNMCVNLSQVQEGTLLHPDIPLVYHNYIDLVLNDDTITVYNEQRDQDFIFEYSSANSADICLDWLLADTTLVDWIPHIVYRPLKVGYECVEYIDTILFPYDDGAIQCTITEGDLPDGLSLNDSTCIIEGTPEGGLMGEYPFTVRVKYIPSGEFEYHYQEYNLIIDTGDCRPGDANGDCLINVGDPVYLIEYIFRGGPPPTPYAICSGDANCDCLVNVGDVIYLNNYIFLGGPAPCTCSEWISECGEPLRN